MTKTSREYKEDSRKTSRYVASDEMLNHVPSIVVHSIPGYVKEDYYRACIKGDRDAGKLAIKIMELKRSGKTYKEISVWIRGKALGIDVPDLNNVVKCRLNDRDMYTLKTIAKSSNVSVAEVMRAFLIERLEPLKAMEDKMRADVGLDPI